MEVLQENIGGECVRGLNEHRNKKITTQGSQEAVTVLKGDEVLNEKGTQSSQDGVANELGFCGPNLGDCFE